MRRILPALAAIVCLLLPLPSLAQDPLVIPAPRLDRRDPVVIPAPRAGARDPDDAYVWHVYGLPPDGVLAIRSGAGPAFRVIGELGEGAPVRHLGCSTQDGAYWCRIATTDIPRISGWVNGRFLVQDWGPEPLPPEDGGYLVPGTPYPAPYPAPYPVPRATPNATPYNATGPISCRLPGDDRTYSCDYGVVRNGPFATLDIMTPDGFTRTLDYRAGRFTAADGSAVSSVKQGGNAVVTVGGAETYYVPDTLIMGE